jgi:hypothetical protein
MDEEVLALVAITLIGAGAVVGIAFSPIARALAARILGRSPGPERREPGREDLEESVDDLKRDVAELSRQLHFMERLMAAKKEPGRLGPGDVAR